MSGSNAKKLLKVIRFHIVAGGVLAFSLGALLALANGGSFNLGLAISAYLAGLLGDLSTHYSNDYFDVEVDKHIEQKKFFSGNTTLVNNPELRSSAKSISIGLLASANILAVATFLFLGASFEIVIIILGATLVGWFYSAPPLRLISRGFGEIALACVTGFAIPAVGYLAVKNQLDLLFGYISVPFMLYGLTLSLSLEAPDAEIDRKGGKKTMIVRKGTRTIFLIILAVTATATLLFFVYSCMDTSKVLEVGVLALFSFAPLAAAIVGIAGVFHKRSVYDFSTLNVASLFIFNILTVLYLLVIVFAS